MKPTIRLLYDLLSMEVATVVWGYLEGPESDKSGARLSIQREGVVPGGATEESKISRSPGTEQESRGDLVFDQ